MKKSFRILLGSLLVFIMSAPAVFADVAAH